MIRFDVLIRIRQKQKIKIFYVPSYYYLSFRNNIHNSTIQALLNILLLKETSTHLQLQLHDPEIYLQEKAIVVSLNVLNTTVTATVRPLSPASSHLFVRRLFCLFWLCFCFTAMVPSRFWPHINTQNGREMTIQSKQSSPDDIII